MDVDDLIHLLQEHKAEFDNVRVRVCGVGFVVGVVKLLGNNIGLEVERD